MLRYYCNGKGREHKRIGCGRRPEGRVERGRGRERGKEKSFVNSTVPVGLRGGGQVSILFIIREKA